MKTHTHTQTLFREQLPREVDTTIWDYYTVGQYKVELPLRFVLWKEIHHSRLDWQCGTVTATTAAAAAAVKTTLGCAVNHLKI